MDIKLKKSSYPQKKHLKEYHTTFKSKEMCWIVVKHATFYTQKNVVILAFLQFFFKLFLVMPCRKLVMNTNNQLLLRRTTCKIWLPWRYCTIDFCSDFLYNGLNLQIVHLRQNFEMTRNGYTHLSLEYFTRMIG